RRLPLLRWVEGLDVRFRQGLRSPGLRLLHTGEGDHLPVARPGQARRHQPRVPAERLTRLPPLLSRSPHSSRSIMSRWFYREGELSQGDWHTVIDTNTPGWRHTGLRIGDVSEGKTFELGAGEVERLLVPLAGSFEVNYTPGSGDEGGGEETVSLEGRTS